MVQGVARVERRVQRVNVDFGAEMLDELDRFAAEMNLARQAVIKMLLRAGLDQHYNAMAVLKKQKA